MAMTVWAPKSMQKCENPIYSSCLRLPTRPELLVHPIGRSVSRRVSAGWRVRAVATGMRTQEVPQPWVLAVWVNIATPSAQQKRGLVADASRTEVSVDQQTRTRSRVSATGRVDKA